jgi:hypothetical protein
MRSRKVVRKQWVKKYFLLFFSLSFLLTSFYGCSEKFSYNAPCFKIIQTRFLGSVWNEGHRKASIISQDGGYSYPTPEGTLWLFGDTFKGSRDETGKPHFAGGAVSCSIALLSHRNAHAPPVLKFFSGKDGTVAAPLDFLPGESREHKRMWPLSGIYIQGTYYMYYTVIEIFGTGAWDFKIFGAGLAFSDKPLSRYKRIQSKQHWEFPVSPTEIVLVDDWLYLYEVSKKGGKQGIWLSRVRPAEIENPDSYEYYCGSDTRFCSDKNKQALFLENIYGQVSIVWNEYLGKYILASSSDFSNPLEIRLYTADKPHEKWGKPVARILVPEYRQNKKVELVYFTYFHPELFRENGRIMNLSFSLQLKDSGFDANNEMIEVEIENQKK